MKSNLLYTLMISTTVQCIVYHISTKRSDQIFNTIVSVIWKNNIIVAVTKTWDWGPFMKDVINRGGGGLPKHDLT